MRLRLRKSQHGVIIPGCRTRSGICLLLGPDTAMDRAQIRIYIRAIMLARSSSGRLAAFQLGALLMVVGPMCPRAALSRVVETGQFITTAPMADKVVITGSCAVERARHRRHRRHRRRRPHRHNHHCRMCVCHRMCRRMPEVTLSHGNARRPL